MAAIARRVFIVALGSFCVMPAADASDSDDVHRLVGELAEALSSGEPAQAMACFVTNYPNYKALSDSFEALTGAYYVESRIGFLDEEESQTEVKMTLHWDLTLTTLQSGFSKNRAADLDLKVVRNGKHWKIAEFAPIAIFDPQND